MPEALFMVFLLDSKGAKVFIFDSVLFSHRRISVNLVDLVKSFFFSRRCFKEVGKWEKLGKLKIENTRLLR